MKNRPTFRKKLEELIDEMADWVRVNGNARDAVLIDRVIALLDARDGDPDFEADSDDEPDADEYVRFARGAAIPTPYNRHTSEDAELSLSQIEP